MGKKVIIAEKPSLAKNIMAAILGNFKKCDGYYEEDTYIVSWAFGHLLELYDFEDYISDVDRKKSNSWSLSDLPFYPENYKFRFRLKHDYKTKKPDPSIVKQFKIIKALCARADVDAIIHAGDADREGEVIVRNILLNNGNKKPVYRLWLPDQTPVTIQRELNAMKSDKEYNNLAFEGFARTYIDWMYGINLTRLATIKSGQLLRVGRVIVPIVKAIYDRDLTIQNFVPEKYFALLSKEKTNGVEVQLLSKHKFSLSERSAAEQISQNYNSVPAIVTDIKSGTKTISPPKLFSLSKLQGVLGKKYKMSLKDSLGIIQKLYEAGYVTYPRTNSEYLATAEKDKISQVISALSKEGYPIEQKDKKSIYDDSKIESHSALTPTYKLAKKDDLNEKEWQVYSTILNRFIAVFCSIPCMVERTTIFINVGDLEEFKIKGDVYISKGWQEYDGADKKDAVLPKLSVGDKINTDFKPEERETTPPKHYTVDSLNNFLKNPFKQEKSALSDLNENTEPKEHQEDDTEDYKALFDGVELGTEATRTGIIEKAIQSNYISFKNNTYYIEQGGKYMIETLDKLCIDMNKEKTAELGRVLKKVYREEISIIDSLNIARNEINQIFENCSSVSIDKSEAPKSTSISLGKCPKCGSDVVKNKFGNFGCSNRKNGCKFTIYRTVAGKKLTESNVKDLLSKGKTREIKGFTSKAGKKFNAVLVLGDDGKISFEFNK